MTKQLIYNVLLIFTIATSSCVYAQNTYIPDNNFEQELINLGYDTGVIDNFVPTANINTITSLNISNLAISDLTGIEDFLALEELDAGQNLLTTVDFSQNLALTRLELDANNIASLDIRSLSLLEYLIINGNPISNLDITQNLALDTLFCSNNNFTTTIDTSQNLVLKNFNCSNNAITSLDLSNNTALEDLNCSFNQMAVLNITQNLLLDSLSASHNLLTNIDTTQNTLLTYLYLDNNRITNIDISQNTLLYLVWIRNNQLSTIDVSLNVAIRSLNLSNNLLTSISLMPPNNTISYLALGINQLSGNTIPASLINYTNLNVIDIDTNNFSGLIPDLSGFNLSYFRFGNNAFEFGDFENEHLAYDAMITTGSFYNNHPQAFVNNEITFNPCEGESLTLTTTVSGSQNTYQWYKGVYPSGTLIAGETNSTLVFPSVSVTNSGDYYCLINSDIVTDLTLVREPLHVNIGSGTITANPVSDISTCDVNNDGFAPFNINFTSIENQVLNGQTGLTVSYYDAFGNPLTFTNPYTNTTIYAETIIVRITDNSGCYDETTFDLIVVPYATVDSLPNENVCGQFILPQLTNGNYFTQSGGNGTALVAGDVITVSQTIYIYNDIGNGCASETSFMITITPSPNVDILNDEIVCDRFILPTLNSGNYFTASGGTGMTLSAGDSITNSQTIFIYEINGNCSSESNFNIIVNTTPIPDILNHVNTCDGYTLPSLNTGNYFTASEGLGTQLNAGDYITSTQTIFIYAENGTCNDETFFEVTINPAIDFELSHSNLQIESQDITINMSDLSLNYLFSIDGTNYQSNNQFFGLDEGTYTLYVSDESTCIIKSIVFEINTFTIPSFFTPNGDNINEVWQISDSQNTIQYIHILIVMESY